MEARVNYFRPDTQFLVDWTVGNRYTGMYSVEFGYLFRCVMVSQIWATR